MKRNKEAGKYISHAPGTVSYRGEKPSVKPDISSFVYNIQDIQENEDVSLDEIHIPQNKSKCLWLNINGVHDEELILEIGRIFKLDDMTMEDIVHIGQRPKYEEIDDYLHIVIKMLIFIDDTIEEEQITLITGENFVISFQERVGDLFDPLRKRLRNGKFRIRSKGVDYLTYSILDQIVDSYFIIIENIGEQIEVLEEEVLDNPEKSIQTKLYNLKRSIIYLRRNIWPLREVISRLSKNEAGIIEAENERYFNDLYDHTIQVIDTIETHRELVNSILDSYLTNISNKMNEIMKILTIIATIFIPLTFIAGIYGMNFSNMPELSWRYGYFAVWLVMIVVFALMIFYFKKKKWL